MAQLPADVSPGDGSHDDHHDELHRLYNHHDTVGGGDVTAAWTAAEKSKLAGIEAAADVTDTTNVTAAGALMDSEVDADIKTLSLPASTTISTFGASLVDDADAATARATLGVPSALDDLSDVTSSGPSDAQVLAWNAPNSDWRPTTFTVPAVLDEDNMATNSATAVPSQQSVKAYVDAEVAGVGGGGAELVTYTSNEPTVTSGAVTLDLSLSHFFYVPVTADITTITVTNAPVATTEFVEWTVRFGHISGGTHTVSFPTDGSFWFPGGDRSFTVSSGYLEFSGKTNGARTSGVAVVVT